MQQPLTTEQRLELVEKRVAELERQRRIQEDRDIALLARIDNFIDDLRRVERVQMRAFDELKADILEVKADIHELQAGQQGVVEILADHKKHIEDLAAGQQQIISLLTGKQPPRND